jgi:hypothetical protein
MDRMPARLRVHGAGLPAALEAAILVIHRCLAAGCRLNRRKQKPNTYQLLLDPVLASRT